MSTTKTEKLDSLCALEIKLAGLINNCFSKIETSIPNEENSVLNTYIQISDHLIQALLSIKEKKPYNNKELVTLLKKSTSSNNSLKPILEDAVTLFSDSKVCSNPKKLFKASRKVLRNLAIFCLKAFTAAKTEEAITAHILGEYLLTAFGMFLEDEDNGSNASLQPTQTDKDARLLLCKDFLTIIAAEAIFTAKTGTSRLNFLQKKPNLLIKFDLFEFAQGYEERATSLKFSSHILKKMIAHEAQIVQLYKAILNEYAPDKISHQIINLAGSCSFFYDKDPSKGSDAISPRNRSASRLASQFSLSDLNAMNESIKQLNHVEEQTLLESMLECLKNIGVNVELTDHIAKLLEFNKPNTVNDKIETLLSNLQQISTTIKKERDLLKLSEADFTKLIGELKAIEMKIKNVDITTSKKEISSVLFKHTYTSMLAIMLELTKGKKYESYLAYLQSLPQWITANNLSLGDKRNFSRLPTVLATNIIKIIEVNIQFKLSHDGLSVREYLNKKDSFPPEGAKYLIKFSQLEFMEQRELDIKMLNEILAEETAKLSAYKTAWETFVPVTTFAPTQPRPPKAITSAGAATPPEHDNPPSCGL